MSLTLPQIGTGLAALLPKAAAAALILAIAFSLAHLTWWFAAPPAESALDRTAMGPAASGASAERPDYAAQIARLHLFGEADQAAAQAITDAPETQLNLTLLGVYATDDGDALAIIDGGAQEKVYGIGEEITGGVSLKAVYGDRVILAHNQRIETLRLRKDEGAEQFGVEPLPGYDAPASDSDASSGAAYSGDLGELRAELISNPEQLGRLIQMRPVSENGQFQGYRIQAGDNQELFAQLGLQDGDVVTSVNDITLNRPEQGLAALRNLVNAEQVTLTVLRNGSELTLQQSF